MTPARRLALELVAQGKIYLHWPFGAKPPEWMTTDHYAKLRPAPYEWLQSQDYIEVLPGVHMKSVVRLTDEGREILEQQR